MAVRVKKKGTQLREAGVTNLVAEFAQVKKMKAMWEERERALRKRVDAIMDAYGEADDKGHLWYTLPQEVDGITKLYRQKRVSQTLNEDVAEALLSKMEPTEDSADDLGDMPESLWDQCTRTVVVIDEDAVLAFAYKKVISEEQLAEMYEEAVSYALYLK